MSQPPVSTSSPSSISGTSKDEVYEVEEALRALLHWYEDMGVNDLVSAAPVDFYNNFLPDNQPRTGKGHPQRSLNQNAPAKRTSPSPKPNTGILRPDANALPTDKAIEEASRLATQSPDIVALEKAVHDFNGCALKKGARNTVFADGVPGAPLLVMGEAPGADEDREGKPFIGRAGLLLDKMLAAIHHDRKTNCYISNTIYWRPPGNRPPNQEEILICRPFVERLIELSQPKIILITGATALKCLLDKSGIMKNRGHWQKITTQNGYECPVMPTFHPAYLLRTPKAKSLVWQDLQKLAARLRD